jgi:arylsulfatase A-like enzyme
MKETLQHILTAFLGVLALASSSPGVAAEQPSTPNILWIIADDMSPSFGCYGERTIETPNVDGLAAAGTRFARAFVTAPVCSPCRSALITGMYQTTIGSHHHRSGRGREKIHLPEPVEPLPVLFRRAGYHTSITGWPIASNPRARGKTDYNFEWDESMYDGNDWRGRRPGQPFFAQIQLPGGKLRDGGGLREGVKRALGTLAPPERVVLPPYYPDDPVIRADWAAYLDACRETDRVLGEILARLDGDGLSGSTVVFFMTDHGISHARGKQYLYDEGTHVPLIASGPGIAKGAVREDLVEHIDLAATSLALAGIDVPRWMQGRNLLAADHEPRDAVFAARDRCDETVDRIRAVRTARFKYIRNFLPERPHLQPNAYKDNKPTLRRLRQLHERGELESLPERLLFASRRAPEELYDLESDPFETNNLAADPAHEETLMALRERLERWMSETGDRGRQPEAAAMYESDMAVYLDDAGKQPSGRAAEIERNIRLMEERAAAAPRAGRAARPNILLIVADDLGWADVGWHGARIRTPHMDRLVRGGVELDQHYVHPVCTPTRTALLSGRYPSRFGPQALTPSNLRAMPLGTETLASVLRSAGYTTYQAGKWHLGSRMEWGPNAFGFQHSYGSLAGAVDPWRHTYRAGPYEKTWHRDGRRLDEEGNATELVAAQAVRWIEEKRSPWFLYVAFHAVHIPIDAPEEYRRLYAAESFDDDPARDESYKRFAAFVTQMDAKIGELVSALERTGQRERTFIVFTSDNGGLHRGGNPYVSNVAPAPRLSSNLPLRGQKGQLYEGGIRACAFAHWPGVLVPRKLSAPVHAVDWMPTLGGLAGATSAGDPARDGRDIWPLLTGEVVEPEPRTLYWPYAGSAALRQGDWKLIEALPPARRGDASEPAGERRHELFNLATDPGEKEDLAGREPERLARLRAALEDMRRGDLTELPEDLRGLPR